MNIHAVSGTTAESKQYRVWKALDSNLAETKSSSGESRVDHFESIAAGGRSAANKLVAGSVVGGLAALVSAPMGLAILAVTAPFAIKDLAIVAGHFGALVFSEEAGELRPIGKPEDAPASHRG